MTKHLGCFLILCLSVVSAAAQDDYTGDDLEKFITKILKKEFKKKEVKNDVIYAINGGFRVLFDEEKQQLEFFEQYTYELPKNGKVEMATKLAAWNKKATLSRAKEVGYTPLGFNAGSLHVVRFSGFFDMKKLGEAKLKTFYEKLDLEFEDFVIYMQDLLKHHKKGKSSSALPRVGESMEWTFLRQVPNGLPLKKLISARRDELQ